MAKSAAKKSSFDKYRREELAKIHIGKKDLGLSDDIYRDILWNVAKVESSADLDYRGRAAVLEHFKALGWKPKQAAKKKQPPQPSRPSAVDPQSRMIRFLWLELHAAGKVKDPSEGALGSYVKRMTGVAALQWLNVKQASTVIEALKQWKER